LDSALRMCGFTLIDDRIPSHELTLVSALKAGSIPVILSDSMVLPFDELIQWPSKVVKFFVYSLKWMCGNDGLMKVECSVARYWLTSG
uniref:Exostosin domain-containing protein n=1 Tax=Anisakis simplex TaxID=6269 RepID=A0A0M3JLK2_ANISI